MSSRRSHNLVAKRRAKKSSASELKRSQPIDLQSVLTSLTPSVLYSNSLHLLLFIEYMLSGESMGPIIEHLFTKPTETIVYNVLYVLLVSHGVGGGSENSIEANEDYLEALVAKIAEKKDPGKVRSEVEGFNILAPKCSQSEKVRRERLEGFLESFCAGGIENNCYSVLEDLIEILHHFTLEQKRVLRLIFTHALMVMLKELSVLLVKKESYVEELKCRGRSTSEVEQQSGWVKNTLITLRDKVLLKRNNDVMAEVRLVVAETMEKMLNSDTLEIIIDKRITKAAGQFVIDKNKAVRKLGLKLIEQGFVKAQRDPLWQAVYNSGHVTKIVQIGYHDTSQVATQAIRTLGTMREILDEHTVELVCKLVLRNSPTVAKEAASFLVSQGKILGIKEEIKEEEAIESMENLTGLLTRVLSGLDHKRQKYALKNALAALSNATVTTRDLKSMCVLLMRGEKDQAGESKLSDTHLNLVANMIYVLFKGEQHTHEAVGERKMREDYDAIMLEFLPELLVVHKHNEWIVPLIKSGSKIHEESISRSEANMKRALKILKEVCRIFADSVEEKVISAACKVFMVYFKLGYINAKFKSKVIAQFKKYFAEMQRFLENPEINLKNSKNPYIIKLPILLAHSDQGSLLKAVETLHLPLVSILIEGLGKASPDNLFLLCRSLFFLNSSAFSFWCSSCSEADIYKYQTLRNNTLKVFVGHMKSQENNFEFRIHVFTLLVQLLSLFSNDFVKLKHPLLYFAPDNELLNELSTFLMEFARRPFENYKDEHALIYEVNQAIETLILVSEKAFHSQLSILYLAIFGSNQQNAELNKIVKAGLQKLKERCKRKQDYYNYFKEAILACYSFEFNLSHKTGLDTSADSINQNNFFKRIQDLAKLPALECKRDKESLEAYQYFVIELLKAALKKVDNFPLLQVVQELITKELYSKEKLAWLYQLFDALSQHVIKVDPMMKEADKTFLKGFKTELFAKAAARVVKKEGDKEQKKKKNISIAKSSTIKSEDDEEREVLERRRKRSRKKSSQSNERDVKRKLEGLMLD